MKTSFTAFAPCGDTMAHRGRAQPVAGRLRVCTAVPPSHPRQTSISACLQRATLQHLSSMNSPCLWHCPLLCRAAIRALRQKGREAGSKTVSAQWITFRPSTQATGGWPLPGDDINTDKQRTWALTKCGSQRIQIWKQKKLTAQRVWSSWWWWWWKGRLWAVKKYKFHGKFALQTKGGGALYFIQWLNDVSLLLEDTETVRRSRWRSWMDTEAAAPSLPFLPGEGRDLTLLRLRTGGNKRDLLEMTSCQIN